MEKKYFDPFRDLDDMPEVDGMSQIEQEDLFVKNTLMGCAAYVLIPIAMLILVFLFEGCATGRSVESERVIADTVTLTHWKHDSIYIETLRTDSIVVRQDGDTIILNHWRTEWRDRWRERVVHDSIYIHHTDTLFKETVVEKPGKMTAWQRARMAAGTVAMAVLVVAVLVWTRRR